MDKENCKDRDCEFLRHGKCVVEGDCVWQLSKNEEDYEQAMSNQQTN